ncbi:hypothetical protein RvY_00597 [Ramazzottius varieornatus]|uniref:Uncharacterized protein n=1 Tax=Ramazzottius varieornatus TaxID=947166 RepID=A0A1D1UDC3_RAMVA|nr:hypothetical protein RvY_00597 [Ramazzottius varieornatus]
MSIRPSQGEPDRKQTGISRSPEILAAQDQIRRIRLNRDPYKALQSQVRAARARKQELISEVESCTRDIANIDIIGTYVRRKVEFYTVACGALQKEIDDARAFRKGQGQRDYLSESWLTAANTDLLATIVTDTAVNEAEVKERWEELMKRRQATMEYKSRKGQIDKRIGKIRVEAHQTTRAIQIAKSDRDALRIFMHEHADRHFQTVGEYDTYIRRQEIAQSLKALEHRIAFVSDLNQAKVKEVCSAFRFWLERVKRDNVQLYEVCVAAWKWTPTNRFVKACRSLQHKAFNQRMPAEQAKLLEEQTKAIQQMLECENQSERDIARSGLDLLHFRLARSDDTDEKKRNYLLDVLDKQQNKLASLEFKDRMTKEIVYLAVQQASKIAHQLRSPDLIFSAVVHEGLVVLQRQYLAVTEDRNFALGPSPSVRRTRSSESYRITKKVLQVLLNPKKYSETCSSIDWLEFLPYGETEGGVLVRDRRKNKTTYIWFSSFDEQRDFLDLVNGERDAGKKGLDQTKDVPAKNKTTKIFLQNFQQRKFKIRGRGDAMTVLNLGEGRSLIPEEYTV